MDAAAQSPEQRYRAAAARFGAAIERPARGHEAQSDAKARPGAGYHAALWHSFAYFEEQCSERSRVYRIAHNVR